MDNSFNPQPKFKIGEIVIVELSRPHGYIPSFLILQWYVQGEIVSAWYDNEIFSNHYQTWQYGIKSRMFWLNRIKVYTEQDIFKVQ